MSISGSSTTVWTAVVRIPGASETERRILPAIRGRAAKNRERLERLRRENRNLLEQIEKRVVDKSFAQIQLTSRSTEPVGRQRYWPIFEAAAHYGMPIGMHIGGEAGHGPTASGWPSFYIEDHHGLSHSMQCQATSMILEGVFERFPTLKVILIEGGLAWGPSLAWRLDAHWAKLRSEVPHLTMKPSDYMKRNIWFSTQPMEEPENPEDLRRVLSWIGWDRLVFATDYPHWDFDDPTSAFPCRLSEAERRMIFRDNALSIYRL